MSKVEITEIIRANHELVKDNKIEFAARLSGLCLAGSELQVALYLAVFKANGTTGQCNPKVKTIVAETGLPISTVEKAIRKLKALGIIALTIKGKFTSWYYLSMPEVPAEIEAIREENRKKARKQNPSKTAGNTRQKRRVSYEVGKGTVGKDFSVSAGERSGYAGPADFVASIDARTLAGSRESFDVDSDIGRQREKDSIEPSLNIYKAMKDGDIPLQPDTATLLDERATIMKKVG